MTKKTIQLHQKQAEKLVKIGHYTNKDKAVEYFVLLDQNQTLYTISTSQALFITFKHIQITGSFKFSHIKDMIFISEIL